MCVDARCKPGGRDTVGLHANTTPHAGGETMNTGTTSNRKMNIAYVVASIIIIIGYIVFYMVIRR
jgi:hypothetical protein